MVAALALPVRRRLVLAGALATALLVLLAAVGVAVLSYLAADRLVHPPREVTSVTPAWRGIDYEDVSFVTEDDLHLAGWWMPATVAPAEGTVVFLHGYGATKAQSLSVAPFLHRAGYHVLAFDFRAHGASEGDLVTFGLDETKDVRAAYSWLVRRGDVDPQRVALFGWSMGGATAILASPSLPDVKAVVADSAFARLDNVVSNSLATLTGLPAFPFSPLTLGFASWMTSRHVEDAAPAQAAHDVPQPILLIHGQSDGLVRPDVDAIELQRAAGERGELWVAPGADHVNARRYHPQEYEHRVLAFLDRALGEPAPFVSPLPPGVVP